MIIDTISMTSKTKTRSTWWMEEVKNVADGVEGGGLTVNIYQKGSAVSKSTLRVRASFAENSLRTYVMNILLYVKVKRRYLFENQARSPKSVLVLIN